MSFFELKGDIGSTLPFGDGHINDTYRVINSDISHPDYLLQRINHTVFKDVDGLMNNLHEVNNFIRTKLKEAGITDVNQRAQTLIKTRKNELYTVVEGDYWRVFEFLELKSENIAKNTNQIYEGAKAFGNFLYTLRDYPVNQLIYTIPDFHNMILRMNQFDQAIRNTQKNLSQVDEEVKLVREYGDSMCVLENLNRKKVIPLRVVHHDTKFNNVLFNSHDEGMCVIDLDTVMPGIVHSDFGDGIRTGAATAGEEENDLDKIGLNIDKFRAFANGYLEKTSDILTNIEKKHLVDSVLLFPFMQGVRFLTDYLNGNIYYKTTYEDQNLNRALNQFQLFKHINKRKNELAQIIDQN